MRVADGLLLDATRSDDTHARASSRLAVHSRGQLLDFGNDKRRLFRGRGGAAASRAPQGGVRKQCRRCDGDAFQMSGGEERARVHEVKACYLLTAGEGR